MSGYTYEFEKNGPAYGEQSKVREDLKVFLKRLGVAEPSDSLLSNALLLSYVKAHQRAAHWYSIARDKRRCWQNVYGFGRIFLLVALPLLLYWHNSGSGFDQSKPKLTTEITAVLAGLLGAFRAGSSWLEKKMEASNLAQAASALKGLVYSFEAKWVGKNPVTNDVLSGEFEDALREGISAAQKVVEDQRQAYFDNSKPEKVEIATTLSTSKASLTKWLKDMGVV